MNPGQRLHGVKGVVMIIEMDNGARHGWQIIDPTDVEWIWQGTKAATVHGTIKATGEFFRMNRGGQADALTHAMEQAAIEEIAAAAVATGMFHDVPELPRSEEDDHNG